MIKRIKYIKNVGIFRDYKWPEDLPEFARKNLIYGWNYSGKTTLSRIFKSLETGKVVDETWRFELVTSDNAILSHKNLSANFPIRVFNREYVENNFQQENVAEAIFIVGEKNIYLQKRLKTLRHRKESVRKILQKLVDHKNELQDNYLGKATDEARIIREILNEPKFNRKNLLDLLNKVDDEPKKFQLTEGEEAALKKRIKSLGTYESIREITWNPPDLNLIMEEVNSLLRATASQKALDELKNNRALEEWVREGLKLHEDSNTCKFCKNKLTQSRIDELKKHFSKEYQRLVEHIREKIKELEAITKEKPTFPDRASLVPELRTEYENKVEALHDRLQWFNEVINELIKELKKKLENIESTWSVYHDLSRAKEGSTLIAEINSLIKKHNGMIADADREIKKAKEQLKLHYAANFVLNPDAKKLKRNIKTCEKKISKAEALISKLLNNINELESKTRESVIGAQRLNDLLRQLLPGNPIQAITDNKNKYIIQRENEPARNLSEGEKTAITFAHFLTKLEELGEQLEQAVVFIDDPISSLDSNHIYGVYGLINGIANKCGQMFVSTHNSELFNLLKEEWLDQRNGGANTKDSHAYMLWRVTDEDLSAKSKLLDLPETLRKFKSEYEFSFSMLFEFTNKSSPSIAEAYVIPNLLRKFLEAYLGFRNPSIRAWRKKLNILIDEPTVRDRIAKFADDASHLQNLNQALKHPYFITNAQEIVSLVLDSLHAKDKEHYHALLKVIGVEECKLCSAA